VADSIPGDSKICVKCGILKPLSDFYKQSDMRDGYRNNCKPCHLNAHKDWYLRNREYEIARVSKWQQENADRVNEVQRINRTRRGDEYKRQEREGHLRRKYGLTQNMYEALVLAQLGKCAVCGANEATNLHVDHDHRTNKVRGLLCGKCNKAIGLLNDDPDLMLAAKRFLERSAAFWESSPSRSVSRR
jgi:hypothetical protein